MTSLLLLISHTVPCSLVSPISPVCMSIYFSFFSFGPFLVLFLPSQSERVRQVVEETKTCYNEIIESLAADVDMKDMRQAAAVNVHLEAVRRNKRCGVAYVHERARRIETARWEVGKDFPSEMRDRMSASETEYVGAYSKILEQYQRAIELDLTTVRCSFFECYLCSCCCCCHRFEMPVSPFHRCADLVLSPVFFFFFGNFAFFFFLFFFLFFLFCIIVYRM